ncbi:T9SS type A sorting domain-containing protein [Kaistella sp.]|uniref:T9SS type A sorting domain-containing protein n=1 Tax=Kaistella sp. TaxID=2782235 RepID=UPI002F939314
MKKSLHFLKNRLLTALFILWSAAFFAQTTLVNYQFTNNLTADPGALGNPVLKYYNPSGNEIPATFDNNMLSTTVDGNYLELSIDATGHQSMVISFNADFTALFIAGSWNAQANTGAGNSYVDIGTVTMFALFNSTDTANASFNLPVAANGKADLKIRITSNFATIGGARLRLDNLKLTSGSPNIKVYNNSNVHIPHLSPASVALTTDFGTRQTTDPALTRTFRVRNFQGDNGSVLNVSNITVTGVNSGDFTVTPTALGNIGVSINDADNNSARMKTFTISFLPLGDGIRTAEINLYSNSAPSPYTFTVVGMGASCNLESTAFAVNSMAPGVQTLVADYNPSSDLIGGFTTNNNAGAVNNTLGIRLFPNNSNLHTSSSTSWYVRNASKTVEFGGASGLDISGQKNVAIEFRIAAFATANNRGVNSDDEIKLFVLKPDNTWSEELKLNGSNSSNTYYFYDFNGGETLSGDYDGNNLPAEETNRNIGFFGSTELRYKKFVLNIPASANISNLKFRITANTGGNNRMWLIDDVRVLTSNAVYKTWNGSSWSPSAPTANEKAVFTGVYNVPAVNLNICECEVVSTGGVTIPANRVLNVRGKITNHGNGDNFVIKTGGNLIQIEDGAVNTGSITAERLVSDINNISTHMDYLYWSAPVTGQNLQDFSPGTPANRIFQYNEPNDLFKAVPLATEPNFVPGKGYAFRAESGTGISNPYSKTYKFKGVPNNGLIEREVQRSLNTGAAADVVHGYNLIGNPYPSNMSFEQFYQLNEDVIYNTAWFWTNNFFTPNQQGSGYGQNNYAVWNGTGGVAATAPADNNPSNPTSNTTTPNGIVTVGQGFIVQVKNLGLGQKVQFRNRNGSTPVRVSNVGTFYSRQNEEKDRFWLKLISADSIVNRQLIGYIDGATNGFEQDYDAEIMGMSSDIFYSTLEGRKLQIQGKAAFDPTDKVLLGANIFKNGTYTIAIENPEGIFNAGQKVYLKDNLLNRWVDLNAQAYTFEATKGLTEGRFEIVYESPTILDTDAVTKDELMVYRDSGDFVVRAKSKKITMLEVYDASGRLVYTAKPNDTKVVISGDHLNRGVYILKISQDGVVTAKKILK